MIKDGDSGAFDILNAAFIRVLIMFLGFRIFSAYYISVKKLAHTPNKIFLWIVGPYVNRNSIIAEAVIKDFGNVQDWLGSYGIEICEKRIGAKNNFNGDSAIVGFHGREEGADGVIIGLVRPAVRETLVRLSHWENFIETTKLGGSF